MCVFEACLETHQAQLLSLLISLLQWLDSALLRVKFDLILLHPALFLPRGQPLVALKTHEPPTYANWTVVDRELREQSSPSDSTPYPPFSYTRRQNSVIDHVNPFLLILNAGLKLRYHEKRYGFGFLTDRQRELALLTLEAYDLIYYRPLNFTPQPPPTAVPSIPHLLPQTGAPRQVPNTSPQMNDLGSVTPGSVAGNDRTGVDSVDEDEDEDEDDEERGDSESENDGELLSSDECDMILAKFNDPNTTLEERQNLGELLFNGIRRESLLLLSFVVIVVA